MPHISIIEDDRGLNDGIVLALKQDSFTFSQYYRLKDAKDISRSDLLILDINLPDGNGFDYMQQLRRTSDIPIIVLTANDLETDEVRGLELGADDYITKPFSLMVLRTRIHKALEKAGKKDSPIYRRNGFFFDFEKMYCCKNGEELQLSKTEQKLLSTLVRNRNITITRDVLVDRIWTDGGEFVDENALSVVIKRLRDKLEQDSSKPQYIQTVYGKGYVWKD
ncbi:MAG: response regulator transcription factor [Firmicutes bacterium]|nr:response regulator transcription factor [Bacillota bacterium]